MDPDRPSPAPSRAVALARCLLPARLGTQLRGLVALVLVSTFAAFGAYTIRQQSAMALDGISQQARALSRNLALLSEGLVLGNELDRIEELLRSSMEFAQVHEILVVDPRGAPISRVVRDAQGVPRAVFDAPGTRLPVPAGQQAQVRVDADAALVTAWHPVVAGGLLAWVRVEHGTAALVAIRERILASTAVVGLLAALASAMLLTMLLRRPLRALDAARTFAVDLQQADGRQLARIEGPRETVELGQALNHASSRLQQQRLTIEASIGELRRQEAVLAEVNEQLNTLFSLSPDGLVSIDAAGLVRFANPAFHRLTGLSPGEVIDGSEAQLDRLLRARQVQGGEWPGMSASFPPAADEAGARTHSKLRLARPRDTVLELVGLLSQSASARKLLYIRDVTRESEIDRMKSEFLSAAAHELRTPMTGIHACVELLMAREFDADRRAHLLAMAHRHSVRMTAIVDDLLDLARIEARGAADFSLVDADLSEAVAAAVADFVPPPKRSAPEIELQGVRAMVRFDRLRLAAVLRNLLSNAYKYSQDGAVHVRLLALRDMDAMPFAGLEVEDHGIGMTPEQVARVCERFWRADDSGHRLGTGLGMSIVRESVEAMQGALEIHSTPDRGTTVRVWLPIAALPPGPSPAVPNQAQDQGVLT